MYVCVHINKLTSPCSNSSFSSDVHFKEQPGDLVGERTLGMQEAEISAFPNPDILQSQSLKTPSDKRTTPHLWQNSKYCSKHERDS